MSHNNDYGGRAKSITLAHLSTRVRNLLVLTFLLNGGLYQSMLLRCLFFRLLVADGS